MFSKIFLVLVFLIDLVALGFVLYATFDLLYQYLKIHRKKSKIIISNKEYHLLRSTFGHRISRTVRILRTVMTVKKSFLSYFLTCLNYLNNAYILIILTVLIVLIVINN